MITTANVSTEYRWDSKFLMHPRKLSKIVTNYNLTAFCHDSSVYSHHSAVNHCDASIGCISQSDFFSTNELFTIISNFVPVSQNILLINVENFPAGIGGTFNHTSGKRAEAEVNEVKES